MRRDLQSLQETSEIAVDLNDRAPDGPVGQPHRAINRLCAQLLEYFPAPKPAFDYSVSKTALVLLTGYRLPDAGRRARVGRARLPTWLKNHGLRVARHTRSVADSAVTATEAQSTAVPREKAAAR